MKYSKRWWTRFTLISFKDLRNSKRWHYTDTIMVDINLLEIHHSKIIVWLINKTTLSRYKFEWRMYIYCLSNFWFLKTAFDNRFNKGLLPSQLCGAQWNSCSWVIFLSTTIQIYFSLCSQRVFHVSEVFIYFRILFVNCTQCAVVYFTTRFVW